MTLFDIFSTPAGPGIGAGLVTGAVALGSLVAAKVYQDRGQIRPQLAERMEARREAKALRAHLNEQQQSGPQGHWARGTGRGGQWANKNRRDGGSL